MALLEVENVKKSFRLEQVLKGITFDIQKGEIFGLVGVSGGGKSTIFNILMGLVKRDSGDILFQGEKLSDSKNKLRLYAGFATQSNMIFEELTIKENGLYFGSLYGMKKSAIKKRIYDLTMLLGLKGYESKLVRNLSGGMKKRANILISLIHSPKLLILDEPTVGLDPILRRSLWRYIKDINKGGTTVIIASHLLDEIGENCHRIGVLKDGKVVAIGTPQQYLQKYGRGSNFREIFEAILSR